MLNKYYPPDFDGAKLPRNKRPRDQQELIRFMLPVTVRCNTCGEYMYAGKKFNVKKETVLDEVRVVYSFSSSPSSRTAWLAIVRKYGWSV